MNAAEKKYLKQLAKLYGVTIDEIVAATRSMALDPDKPFSFDDFPSLKGKSKKIFDNFTKSLLALINTATGAEWTKACRDADALMERIMKTAAVPKSVLEGYGDRNLKALAEFQTRKINGMNLSERVWKTGRQLRQELELALDLGIGDGLSAAELSRDVRQYLNNPDKLFRRVRDKHGNPVLSKSAKAYRPGAGNYRSSYKNAMRLTRTEINMAYREADGMCWQKLDFVVGFEVKLSNNHTINGKPFTDICDELQGKYPKDFRFTGWHPQCRCFSVPVLMTVDEMKETGRMRLAGEDVSGFRSQNTVDDVPENFKKWVGENQDRIEKANNRGTLPYFLKDNANFAGISVNKINLTDRAEYIREARAKYDSYDSNVWKSEYFDESTGGYLVTEKGRIVQSQKSDNEKEKFDKEQEMCETLAKNGYKIEHRDDNNGESYDIHMNTIKADLKKTSSHNNIVNYAKEAVRKQGASMVVFEFTKETEKIHREIKRLQSKGIHGKYYFSKNKYKVFDF